MSALNKDLILLIFVHIYFQLFQIVVSLTQSDAFECQE